MDKEQVRLFASVLAGILSPIALALLFRGIRRSNQKELDKSLGKERVTLRMPKLYLVVGIVFTGIMSIGFIAAYSQVEERDLLFLFTFFSFCWLLGFSILIPYFTWKIELSKSADFLIYRSFIGRWYKIRYEDVLYYENGSQGIVVTWKKKKFSVGYEVTNFERLIEAFTAHGIERFHFYEWQKTGKDSESEQEQPNGPISKRTNKKHHFYQGKKR